MVDSVEMLVLWSICDNCDIVHFCAVVFFSNYFKMLYVCGIVEQGNLYIFMDYCDGGISVYMIHSTACFCF